MTVKTMAKGLYGPSYLLARQERMSFASNCCETCKRNYSLECHHASSKAYELDKQNKLTMRDVVILCRDCHDAVTSVIRERRYVLIDLQKGLNKNEFTTTYCAFDRTDSTSATQQSMCKSKESTEKTDCFDHLKRKAKDGRGFGSIGEIGICSGTVHQRPAWTIRSGAEPTQNAN